MMLQRPAPNPPTPDDEVGPMLLKINRGAYESPRNPNVVRGIVCTVDGLDLGTFEVEAWTEAQYERLPCPRPEATLTPRGIYQSIRFLPAYTD